MSSIQFSGLTSGLDTAGIIDSLMAVEAGPQNALKIRLGGEQNKLGAMQALNSAIQSLVTSASSFSTGSTWKSLTATSSNSNIAISAGTTASAANFNVTVNTVASAAKVNFSDAHALTDVVADADSQLTLTLGGNSYTVETGDGTFKTILDNISALTDGSGKAVVSASSVNLGNGSYRALLTAASTGAGTISLSGANLNLGTATATAGSDASIDLGGITVTSTSNTFTDVIPGVTLTLGSGLSAGATSDIAIKADPESRANAIKALVSQLNDVLGSISAATSYGSISTTSGSSGTGAGALSGDSVVRGFAQQLLNTIYTPGGGATADIGVTIDRYGKFVFDQAKFNEAYAADPSAVQDAIAGTEGFAARLVTVSRQISGTAGLQSDNTILSSDGQLTAMIKQQQGSITRYSDQIASWDDRLERKRASLQVIYTNLETALSRLSAQQSWLEAQLESLNSSSSK